MYSSYKAHNDYFWKLKRKESHAKEYDSQNSDYYCHLILYKRNEEEISVRWKEHKFLFYSDSCMGIDIIREFRNTLCWHVMDNCAYANRSSKANFTHFFLWLIKMSSIFPTYILLSKIFIIFMKYLHGGSQHVIAWWGERLKGMNDSIFKWIDESEQNSCWQWINVPIKVYCRKRAFTAHVHYGRFSLTVHVETRIARWCLYWTCTCIISEMWQLTIIGRQDRISEALAESSYYYSILHKICYSYDSIIISYTQTFKVHEWCIKLVQTLGERESTLLNWSDPVTLLEVDKRNCSMYMWINSYYKQTL